MEGLDILVAENACRRLITEYCRHISPLDVNKSLSLFANDASVIMLRAPPLTLTGRDAIGGFLLAAPPSAPKLYIATNVEVEIVDSEHARGGCLTLVIETAAAEGRPFRTGALAKVLRYDDLFIKTRGGWVFHRREVTRLVDNE